MILDLHMPKLDGFTTVATLRQDAQFASTPILALTASAMMGDRERALGAGFTGYVTKPIRVAALRAEVERLLDGVAGNLQE
jgi:CheY-like chemotaxis protein